jgi:hypothetical protein
MDDRCPSSESGRHNFFAFNRCRNCDAPLPRPQEGGLGFALLDARQQGASDDREER